MRYSIPRRTTCLEWNNSFGLKLKKGTCEDYARAAKVITPETNPVRTKPSVNRVEVRLKCAQFPVVLQQYYFDLPCDQRTSIDQFHRTPLVRIEHSEAGRSSKTSHSSSMQCSTVHLFLPGTQGQADHNA